MALPEEIARSATAREALGVIIRHFSAESGTIHIIRGDGLLHLAAAIGDFPAPVMAAIRVIPVGKGMAGLAAERGKPVDSCNIQTDASGDVRPGARITGLGGAIAVPIFEGSAVIGALGIANRAERTFSELESADLIEAARLLPGRRLADESGVPDAGK
jgi:signal transduction protein with GAF and PtsI domain